MGAYCYKLASLISNSLFSSDFKTYNLTANLRKKIVVENDRIP